jgi:hypothetical protein
LQIRTEELNRKFAQIEEVFRAGSESAVSTGYLSALREFLQKRGSALSRRISGKDKAYLKLHLNPLQGINLEWWNMQP